MFGAPASQRGSRGPQISCPRPQWPQQQQQRAASPNHTYQPPAHSPVHSYSPLAAYGSSVLTPNTARSSAPSPAFGVTSCKGRASPVPPAMSAAAAAAAPNVGPKPFYRQSTYNSSARSSPIICQTPGTPPEFLYSSATGSVSQHQPQQQQPPQQQQQYQPQQQQQQYQQQQQQQYDFRQPSPQHQQLHQQFVGAPPDATYPQPKSYVIYDEEEEQGPSTAEIIANQSQDYVDERLAEYQMTIFQLQGEYDYFLN